jgi:hypothetical protein
MTVLKNAYLKKEYLWDFDVDGGATGNLTLRATDPNGNALPEGFVVSKVSAVVEEQLSPTGGEVTFGTTTDPNGYLDNIRAAYNALNSVVRSGEVAGALLWDDTNDHEIDYRIPSTADDKAVVMDIGTNALTQGKIRFIVEGYYPSDAAGYEN